MKYIAPSMLIAAVALSACAGGLPQRLGLAQARCQDISFPIYFSEGSDSVTPGASQAIDAAADKARGCHVGVVRVTGLADAKGGALANLDLSQRRTANVARLLAAKGFPAPTFDLDAQGDAGAVLADGRKAPMQRRADVAVHFIP